jgi:hypothetical protein
MPFIPKTIIAVGLGTHADERRVVLLLDSAAALISKRAGLDDSEAELFAEGVLEGLQIAAQGYVLKKGGPAEEATWLLEDRAKH